MVTVKSALLNNFAFFFVMTYWLIYTNGFSPYTLLCELHYRGKIKLHKKLAAVLTIAIFAISTLAIANPVSAILPKVT